MKCENAGHVQNNTTMPTTNNKLSKPPSFFFLDFEQVLREIVFGRKFLLNFLVEVVYYTFSKSKNVSAKKLCGGEVALKIPRKLTCRSSFFNAAGCKTEISVELG